MVTRTAERNREGVATEGGLVAELGDFECRCDRLIDHYQVDEMTRLCEFCSSQVCLSCINLDWHGTGWDVCDQQECLEKAIKKLVDELNRKDDDIACLRDHLHRFQRDFRKIEAFANRIISRYLEEIKRNKIGKWTLSVSILIGRIRGLCSWNRGRKL